MAENLIARKVFWLLVFVAAVFFHVIGVGHPFLGNFAQHQIDYATVVQRWLVTSINPLLPVMRVIGEGQYRIFMGDIPLTMSTTALICKVTQWPIEIVGRGTSVFFFFASLFPFHGLLRLILKDKSLARWILFFYLFSPLTLIYGQSFLLEIPALSFGIFAYYFFFRWYLKGGFPFLLLSGVFFSLELALRIYYAPLMVPIILLLLNRYRWSILGQGSIYIWGFIILSLPLAWQLYALWQGHQQGHDSSLADNLRVFMLADSETQKQVFNPRYYLPILDIFVNKLLTPIGFSLAILGIFSKTVVENKRVIRFSLWSIAAFFILFFITPRKFIEFEYYYMPLVPFAAVLAGFAVNNISELLFKKTSVGAALVFFVILFALRFSMSPMINVPEEDQYVLAAAKAVHERVPSEARVIASHESSPTLLYYCNRDGWSFSLKDKIRGVRNLEDCKGNAVERLERFHSQGAGYFIIDDKSRLAKNPGFAQYLQQKYQLIYESPHALIYSLENPS